MPNKCPLCNQDLKEILPINRIEIAKVIKGWKVLNGIPTEGDESKRWDVVYWPRYVRAASQLIFLFGSWEEAVSCMEYIFYEMKKKNFQCNLETIIKWSDLYREQKGGESERIF